MTRAEAPRRPESVLVVVHTEDRQVLLLQRRQPFDFWQSVTGSLLPGESHADAASRELREETGIVASPQFSGESRCFEIDSRWRHRFPPGVTENTEYEYFCCLPGPIDVSLSVEEHAAAKWLSLEDAIDRVWSWTNRAALRQLQPTGDRV